MSDGTGDSAPSPAAPAGAGDAAALARRASRDRPTWLSLSSPFAAGFFLTLGGLTALVLGLAISSLSTVLIYIVFALFVALGLDPLVRWLERRGVKRPWGIAIVFSMFAVVLLIVLRLIVPTVVEQVAQFIDDIPTIITGFMASDAYAWLEANFGNSIGNLLGAVQSFLTDPGNLVAIGGGVLKVGVDIATGVSGAIIVLVLSLYFLASLNAIKRSFYRLVPARNRTSVAGMTDEITDSVGGYLQGMVVLAFFNSVLTFLLYVFLGLPFPLLLAVVAFSITLIPLVGPVLFWVIGSVFALFSNPAAALIFAVVYLVYMQLEAYVLTPRVMNRAISVPGALVVIGALVGGTLLGLLGALVAIPVTASLLLILKQVVIPRQDAKV